MVILGIRKPGKCSFHSEQPRAPLITENFITIEERGVDIRGQSATFLLSQLKISNLSAKYIDNKSNQS